MHKKNLNRHILQQMGVLVEFDIISSTSLEDFMETYREIADSSDDISQLTREKKASELVEAWLVDAKKDVYINIFINN